MSCMPFQVDANSLAASPQVRLGAVLERSLPYVTRATSRSLTISSNGRLLATGVFCGTFLCSILIIFVAKPPNMLPPCRYNILRTHSPWSNRPSSFPAIPPTLVPSSLLLMLPTASSTVFMYLWSQSLSSSPFPTSHLTPIHTSSLRRVTHRTRGSYLCFQLHCPSCCL